MTRQKIGPSSTKHQEKAEKFILAELIAATNSFSLQNYAVPSIIHRDIESLNIQVFFLILVGHQEY
ncbi:hypothetical protein TSUD_340700 [Trifolium subterraneum]|uniref:Uncharacterized protein n=1 Tax=Trifolium subterraneum TaxID=3900 RepID=A0A2Z6MN51_TRISU|nr:hypothetical protein TSUD_340700 [Trifolium subterraneum]